MGRLRSHIDKPLALIILALLSVGLVIFLSASLGQLARGTVSITSILFSHIILGIGLGLVGLFFLSRFNYKSLRKFAPYIYGGSLLLTALTLIPQISLATKGAQRWLLIGPFSLQPAEFLKVGVIVFLAAYLAMYSTKLHTWKYGLGGFLAIMLLPALLLLKQPDTGTFMVIVATGMAMFFAAGGRWKHLGALVLMGILLVGVLAIARPYVKERVMTFFNPGENQQTSGYQIKQSLIAIGSGGLTGRGLGQGVQKFSYLPEPMSDSIFAVAGEELGFIGTVGIIGLFVAFALRGFWIATRSSDRFGALLGTGIVAYIVAEALLNIGAMLGVLPLTGIPLVFMSHGGSAMLVSLCAVGILLNISRSTSAKGRAAIS